MNAKWMMFFVLAASFVTLSGCNTVQGIGKDIERGGQAIERAAKK